MSRKTSARTSRPAQAAQALRVAVSGGSGFVGTHLREYLTEAGDQVIQLVRRKPDPAAHEIGWDPAAGHVEAEALKGIDAIVHLSGENIAAGRWTTARKQRIRDSRVKTTELLAQTLAGLEAPPRVFVCASAVGYYGDRSGAVLTEDAPPGSGFLAEVCQQWEAACGPARAAGVRVVNLRTGVVLSPHGGALAKMLPVFRMGMGGVVGSGDQWLSWIALSDLLRVIEFVITNDGLSGPANAVSPNPVTNRQLTQAIGRVIKRPTLVPLPAVAVRLTMGQMGEETLLASSRVIPQRLQSAGFQFEHPELEEALRYEISHDR